MSLAGVPVVTPVRLVVLVSGLWLVLGGDEWTVRQPWVLLGLAALLLAGVVGAAIVGRAASQLELAVAGSAPDRLAVERVLDGLLLGWGSSSRSSCSRLSTWAPSPAPELSGGSWRSSCAAPAL